MKICPVCAEKFEDKMVYCPHDSEVLKNDPQSMVGEILDNRYEIEAFIAEGGMGTVYRARHLMLNDKVAIKFLPSEMRRNEQWLKRFQREGQAARLFSHPNAVAVNDLHITGDGAMYLVMEYVAGRTLTNILGEFGGKLAPFASIGIIEQVADVLDVAHAAGVVHRDLKPSNIMVADEGGIVKLLDLGVAKITGVSGDITLTNAGQFLGTPPYISPEQWGEPPRDGDFNIDGRADQYALGVIVYQLTSGVLPFKGNTVLSYRRAHRKQPAPDLDAQVARLPPGWAQAVSRAMAKDRADRFDTAGEFAVALRQAVDSTGIASLDTFATAPLTLPLGTSKLSADTTAALPDLVAPTPREISPGPGETTTQIMGERLVTAAPAALPEPETLANSQTRAETPPREPTTLEPREPIALASQPLPVPQPRDAKKEEQPFTPPPPAQSPAARFRPALWGGVALALLLPLIGLGVFLLRGGDSRQAAQTQSAPVVVATPTPTPAPHPFMRYYLVVSGQQQAENEPIVSGSGFEFKFWTSEQGWLYLLGRNKQNKMIAYRAGGIDKTGQSTPSVWGEFTVPAAAKIIFGETGSATLTVIFSNRELELPFASKTLPVGNEPYLLPLDEQGQMKILQEEALRPTPNLGADKKEYIVQLDGGSQGKVVMFDVKLQVK